VNIIALSEGVVALIAILGVIAWGLSGKSKTDTNTALVQETNSLRNQLADMTKERDVWQSKAEQSEKNEEYLKALVLNKPDFGKLSLQLTAQHKQLLTTFTIGTNKMARELGNLAKAIAKDRKDG
jgi:hypothetical protein